MYSVLLAARGPGVYSLTKSRKTVRVDLPNAFIGNKNPPSPKDLTATLGSSAAAWKELTVWLPQKGLSCTEWHSSSPKHGWALRPKLKSRNILYMGPCQGCFRVSLVLGDRAVAAARASDLPKAVLKEIAGAKRYGEGTPVRLTIKTPEDLVPVRILVDIKLAH